MLRRIFDNKSRAQIFYSNFLNEYFIQVDRLEFDNAIATIDSCIKEIESNFENASDNDLLNHVYVTKKYLSCLSSYSRYWKHVVSQEFNESWNALQDIQDELRTIKKFYINQDVPNLNFLEAQITSIEKLYP